MRVINVAKIEQVMIAAVLVLTAIAAFSLL